MGGGRRRGGAGAAAAGVAGGGGRVAGRDVPAPAPARAVLLKPLRAAAGEPVSQRPRAWPTACWSSRRRSWPGRWPGPMTQRCTRSLCTLVPSRCRGIRPIQPAVMWKTARPPACPPSRCWPAPRRCPGWRTTATGRYSAWVGVGGDRTRRFAGRRGSGTRAPTAPPSRPARRSRNPRAALKTSRRRHHRRHDHPTAVRRTAGPGLQECHEAYPHAWLLSARLPGRPPWRIRPGR